MPCMVPDELERRRVYIKEFPQIEKGRENHRKSIEKYQRSDASILGSNERQRRRERAFRFTERGGVRQKKGRGVRS